MHWNAGQCTVKIKKFSSVLRNSFTMSWGEREEGILWPTILLCGMGIEARVTGWSVKLYSIFPHKHLLACPVSTHRHVHVLTSTTHEYLKRVCGQREYFISTVIYIFYGKNALLYALHSWKSWWWTHQWVFSHIHDSKLYLTLYALKKTWYS